MKLIQTKDYLLLIDEEVKIKEGDTVYENISGVFAPYEKEDVVENPIKIIAYYPLSKEAKELDLPLLPNPFENDVDIEDLAFQSSINHYGSKNMYYEKGFIEGYKTSPSKQFSLEDMRKAIEMATWINPNNPDRFYSKEEIIQALSTQRLPKEFIPKFNKNTYVINSEGKEELIGTWKY